MLDIILIIAEIAGCITAVAAAITVFVKPIRNKVFNVKKENDSQTEGLKCLLRTQILEIYYRGRDKEEIDEYEAQNFTKLYDAYKNLGGNSFVDEIHDHIIRWKVIR